MYVYIISKQVGKNTSYLLSLLKQREKSQQQKQHTTSQTILQQTTLALEHHITHGV